MSEVSFAKLKHYLGIAVKAIYHIGLGLTAISFALFALASANHASFPFWSVEDSFVILLVGYCGTRQEEPRPSFFVKRFKPRITKLKH